MAARIEDYFAHTGGPHPSGSCWQLVSTNTLSHVMQEGYLSKFLKQGVRRLDRIQITASSKADVPETADLIVLSVDDGKIKVLPLSKTDAAL